MEATAGLAALGFWLFIGAVVVAGIWYDVREKETRQETLRRIVESGRDIDPAVINRILGENSGRTLERDLRVASYITLSAAVGLLLLGIFLGREDGSALAALIGVALLVACIGGGLYLAAGLVERRYPESQG